jgi:hypothetical protein
MNHIQSWVGNVQEFVSVYGVVLGAFLIATVFILGLYVSLPKKVKVPTLGVGMKKDEYDRQEHERRVTEAKAVAQMIADGLLELQAKGILSDIGYRNWSLRLGNEFNLTDLMPGKISSKELKEVLKKRRNGGTYYGVYKPVNIPGPPKVERKLSKLEEIFHRHMI